MALSVQAREGGVQAGGWRVAKRQISDTKISKRTLIIISLTDPSITWLASPNIDSSHVEVSAAAMPKTHERASAANEGRWRIFIVAS